MFKFFVCFYLFFISCSLTSINNKLSSITLYSCAPTSQFMTSTPSQASRPINEFNISADVHN